jgi:hypothetical protein
MRHGTELYRAEQAQAVALNQFFLGRSEIVPVHDTPARRFSINVPPAACCVANSVGPPPIRRLPISAVRRMLLIKLGR